MNLYSIGRILHDEKNEEQSFQEFSKGLAENWPEIVIRIGTAIVVYFVGALIIKKVAALIQRMAKKKNPDTGEETEGTVGIMVRVCLFVVLAFIELAILGIPVSSVLYVLLALVVAIVIALKDYINTFACGVVILFTRPYRIGDQVEIAGGTKGEVKTITLLATTLSTHDNHLILVPNNKITNNNITNFSKLGIRRSCIKVGISYDQDVYAAKELMLKVMNESPCHLDDNDAEVSVSGLMKNYVELEGRLMINCNQYDEYNDYILEQIKLGFEKAGITVTFG